ncbi:hypothetical protein [Kitasatospora sp. NPDC001095]
MQVTIDETAATEPAVRPAPRRRRHWRFTAVLAVVITLCGAGIGLYLNERNTREQTRELAMPSAPDWIELDVTARPWTPGSPAPAAPSSSPGS